MATDKKAPASTLKELKERIRDMNKLAQDSGIPLAQRIGALNKAQELGQQHLELNAAFFNANTTKYKNAIKGVDKAILKLKESIEKAEKVTKRLENAQKLVSTLDRLLIVATRFAAF